MVGTKSNRNRKLWLSEAWQHYWSVLFPGGIDWRTDLEAEIRNRLYFPGEQHSFLSGGDLNHQSPRWACDLKLSFQNNLVEIKFQNANFGPIPLLTDQLIPALSNWARNNPLENMGNTDGMTGRDRDKCNDFFIAAVRTCGSAIQNHLLRILKDTEQPWFDVYCRPHGDALLEEVRIPEFALSDICRIDIPQNALRDRLGLPKFSYVKIKLRNPPKSKAGPRGSFQEQDAMLVKRMKTLLDKGEAPSVRQAVTMVLNEAPRRQESSDESVSRRLQDRFSRAYPNYSNRRGQKSPR